MWDSVSHGDLQQAKDRLKQSRDEIVQRHAQELRSLETEEAELEALARMADSFMQKFKGAAPSPPASAPSPAAAHGRAASHRAANHRGREPQHYPHTNFDSFSRALSRQL
jgi:hypothetical protein